MEHSTGDEPIPTTPADLVPRQAVPESFTDPAIPGQMVPPDAAPDLTAVATAVAHRWVAAWTIGRTSSLFRLLAAGAEIESNLDPEGDFIEILTDFTEAVQDVEVFSQTVLDGRVALVYDCTANGATFRLAEFLDVDRTGLIRGVRRVYDLAAVNRLLPGLIEQY